MGINIIPKNISDLKYILFFLICMSNAQNIRFYKNPNFTGLLYNSNSTTACNNFPKNASLWIRSFRTDSCFMVYEHLNCDPIYSKKITQDESLEEFLSIRSFHTCNDNNGGSQLDIDIKTFQDDTSSVISPVSLQSYTDVCSCINVPQSVLELEKWLIDNHGNEHLAYFEPNCSTTSFQPTYIRAGHSWLSRNIYKYQTTDAVRKTKHNILSFGPYLNSTYFRRNCKYAKIMELEDFDVSNSFSQNIIIQSPQNDEEYESEGEIQFFASPNFQDLLFVSNSTESCSNIAITKNSSMLISEISSVKTNSCVMVYLTRNCKGRSLKISHGGNNNLTNGWEATVTNAKILSLLYETMADWTWDIKSFHKCKETQQNVDITTYQPDLINSPSIVLKTYENVCSCQNIPTSLGLDQWSINNYEDSIIGYFEQNCSTSKFPLLWIPAGRSSYSMGFSLFSHTDDETGELHKIQSFGPNPNSEKFFKNCIKFYATITTLEIQPEEEDLQNYIKENVEMTSFQTIIQNNGFSNLTQNYSASQLVKEIFQIDIGTSLRNLGDIQLEDVFKIEIKTTKSNQSSQYNESTEFVSNPDIEQSHILQLTSTINNSNLKKAFEKAYQVSNIILNATHAPTIQEYTQRLTVSQTISVPACTEQVVNAYFKKLKIDSIQYRALVKINGKLGDRDVSAAELRGFIDKDLEYIGDFDNFTVLVYSSGNLNGVLGESYFVITNESTIPQCILDQAANCPVCPSSEERDESNGFPPCQVPDEILRQIYGDKLE